MKEDYKSNLQLAILASLTMGLAPFFPEPHIVGKLRWIFGGGIGMTSGDYFDLAMHGAPWVFVIIVLFRMYSKKNNNDKIFKKPFRNQIP